MGLTFDLQAWVETHEVPLLVIDDEYHVVTANRAYERAFAVSRHGGEGKRCHEISHKRPEPCDQAGEECPLARARATGRPHNCIHAHYDASGEVRLVRVHLAPLPAANGQRYYAERIEEIIPETRTAANRKSVPRMVGRSRLFLEMVDVLTSAAAYAGPVLLAGEAGTGKELAARFIHYHSERGDGPFLSLNCAAVPEPLVESELFGHEQNRVAGSTGPCAGMATLADGGTLFLDEVDELPSPVQEVLLRLLEDGEVRVAGGEEMVPVNVRIVAATHRSLWDAVVAGRFRKDLFHRIACFTIEQPPLRDRIGDLPLIVKELLRQIPPPRGRLPYRISREAVEALHAYPYPGNVHELRAILQVAIAYSPPGRIGVEGVRRAIRECEEQAVAKGVNRVGVATDTHGAPLSSAEAERIYLANTLASHGGHRLHAAEALGISERTLYRKLRRYGLS